MGGRIISINEKSVRKSGSKSNNKLVTTEHAILNIKLIHVNFADIPNFSCLNNWQQLFDSDLLTGPIVHKENVEINKTPGYCVISRRVFPNPIDVRSTPKA